MVMSSSPMITFNLGAYLIILTESLSYRWRLTTDMRSLLEFRLSCFTRQRRNNQVALKVSKIKE
jgi:hypothetical protein